MIIFNYSTTLYKQRERERKKMTMTMKTSTNLLLIVHSVCNLLGTELLHARELILAGLLAAIS